MTRRIKVWWDGDFGAYYLLELLGRRGKKIVGGPYDTPEDAWEARRTLLGTT